MIDRKVNKSGTEETYLDGKRHNENDKPAIYKYTSKDVSRREYYEYGKRNRSNGGPSFIHFTAWTQGDLHYITKEVKWYTNSKLHREGGPASITVQYCNGRKMRTFSYWYEKGKLIRYYWSDFLSGETSKT